MSQHAAASAPAAAAVAAQQQFAGQMHNRQRNKGKPCGGLSISSGSTAASEARVNNDGQISCLRAQPPKKQM